MQVTCGAQPDGSADTPAAVLIDDLGGSTNVLGAVRSGSRFWALGPGANTVTFSQDSPAGGTTVQYRFHSREKSQSNRRRPARTAALSVDLAAGAALVGLTELRAYRNTLLRTLALAAADPTNPRHDLLVLDMDTSTRPDTRRVSAMIVTGTPAGTPADPALTQTETHYQLALARAVVAAGATSIAARGITDLQPYSWPQNLVAKRVMTIPVTALTPPSSNGAAAATVHGTSLSYPVLDFDQSTDEHADVWFVMPGEYDGGPISIELRWTAASGTGAVSWEIKSQYIINGGVIDQAPLSRININDTLLSTGKLHVVTGTLVAANGLPGAGNTVLFRITRDTADVGDTLTADARLLGVHLTFDTLEV